MKSKNELNDTFEKRMNDKQGLLKQTMNDWRRR